jgi:hypothetical protein
MTGFQISQHKKYNLLIILNIKIPHVPKYVCISYSLAILCILNFNGHFCFKQFRSNWAKLKPRIVLRDHNNDEQNGLIFQFKYIDLLLSFSPFFCVIF